MNWLKILTTRKSRQCLEIVDFKQLNDNVSFAAVIESYILLDLQLLKNLRLKCDQPSDILKNFKLVK